MSAAGQMFSRSAYRADIGCLAADLADDLTLERLDGGGWAELVADELTVDWSLDEGGWMEPMGSTTVVLHVRAMMSAVLSFDWPIVTAGGSSFDGSITAGGGLTGRLGWREVVEDDVVGGTEAKQSVLRLELEHKYL